MRVKRTWGVVAAMVLAMTCGGRAQTWDGDTERELCRPDPRGCQGQIGSSCTVGDDCEDGVCCQSGDCGGGTCTYLCGSHADCPPTMLCHGGFCFFDCSVDADCGPGQECEQDDTVCQY